MDQEQRPHKSGDFSVEEVTLANRNPGIALEMLARDITPDGMHYQLNHFDIPLIEGETWKLEITGLVEKPLSLNLKELKQFHRHELNVTMECAGNGRAHFPKRKQSMPWFSEAVGTAKWSGVRLKDLLTKTELKPSVSEVVFTGADRGLDHGIDHHYARSLKLEQALHPDMLLAYEMNGQPLPFQHGFPLRLIVPGWFGVASVKWLKNLELIDHAFEGYQQAVNYHYRKNPQDPGIPVDSIKIKSLMIPPGIPDWYTRNRFVPQGLIPLTGRAWSGNGKIEKVEVGIDGVWKPAQLGKDLGTYAWRQWFFDWDAVAGEHTLSCRAYDEAGNTQPEEPVWDESGFGNNKVQCTQVQVNDKFG